MEILTPEIIEKIGLGGITLVILIGAYQIFIMFLDRWQESTEALNRNSDAYQQLSQVFEESLKHEMEFREKQMSFQREMTTLTKQTYDKVSEIHEEVVKRK